MSDKEWNPPPMKSHEGCLCSECAALRTGPEVAATAQVHRAVFTIETEDRPAPPMKRIAAAIDEIVEGRAAEYKAHLSDLVEQLADRDMQIESFKGLLGADDTARRLDEQETLRKYREEQLRLLHEDYADCVREKNEALAAVEEWKQIARDRDKISPCGQTVSQLFVELCGCKALIETGQAEFDRALAERDEAREKLACMTRAHDLLRKRLDAAIGQRNAMEKDRDAARAELAEVREKLEDLRVAPIAIAPATADPRVDALCRIVCQIAGQGSIHRGLIAKHCPNDLDAIGFDWDLYD